MVLSILKNLLGYDLLIIALAVVNVLYVIRKLNDISKALRGKLQSTVYLPIEVLLKAGINDKSNTTAGKVDLHELQALREKELVYYHLFNTINGIFPLLGILGTIIGLLRMVGVDSQMVMSNFTIALTSTFWGLVFSIVFKAVDGKIAPTYYQNQENLQLLFERMDEGIRKNSI